MNNCSKITYFNISEQNMSFIIIMKNYFEIINDKKTSFKEKLKLTNNFDDILFMEKPPEKLVKLEKEDDFMLYKLLINKYK